MTACDEFIENLQQVLPERCTDRDLIECGIFTSAQSACLSRRIGNSPGFFKFGRRIIYPKTGVIEWLKENKHENYKTGHSKRAI